jgi:choice-of-anchor A domain-containing protein
MKKLVFFLFLGVAAASAWAGPSVFDYTLITVNDFASGGAHVHGKALIGGNLSNTQFSELGHDLVGPTADTLIVAGNVTNGSSLRVLKGNMVVGGTVTGTPAIQNGTLTVGALVNTAVINEAKALSAQYAGLSDMGATISKSGSNISITLSAGLNVINVNAADLFVQNAQINFTNPVTQDMTVLFNIASGTNLSLGSSINYGNNLQNAKSRMLWNFSDAETLSFGSGFFGTVMAINAAFSTNSNIDGSAIVGQWANQNTSEVHLHLFGGTIPEPASLMLLAAGSLALLRKRK